MLQLTRRQAFGFSSARAVEIFPGFPADHDGCTLLKSMASAIAFPSPGLPPVTRATLPDKSDIPIPI